MVKLGASLRRLDDRAGTMWNGFVLSDACGGFNGTAEAVDVLHIERGDYVDAGVE